MDVMTNAIRQDWLVLLSVPIVITSILVVAVVIQ